MNLGYDYIVIETNDIVSFLKEINIKYYSNRTVRLQALVYEGTQLGFQKFKKLSWVFQYTLMTFLTHDMGWAH